MQKHLLSARRSPKIQCIQYALDKPGVLTVLPGIRNLQDMKDALAWIDASPEERDYSILGTFTPGDATGPAYIATTVPLAWRA